ncbi:MAG: ATP-binding protein [Planctomycetaceae bacterium]|nr:ATP-binding protein [Planctomycetaceae bacterium]
MSDTETLKKYKILVVDDSRSDLTRATMLLAKNPEWEVLSARSGPEALEIVGNQSPEVIVTDLQMGEMSGLELIQSVHSGAPHIPVVVMTGKGSEKAAMQCLQEGAASYVPKSELARELADTVDRLLFQNQQTAERSHLLKHIRSLEYQIGNDLKLIQGVTHEFFDFVNRIDAFSEVASFQLTTAFEEALTNAYYHGNLEVSSHLREEESERFCELVAERLKVEPYCDRRINILIQLTEEFLSVSMQDQGPGFDVSKLPDPTEDGFIDRPHGRGVLLMRTFMDEVEYNSVGNEVRMVKKLQL